MPNPILAVTPVTPWSEPVEPETHIGYAPPPASSFPPRLGVSPTVGAVTECSRGCKFRIRVTATAVIGNGGAGKMQRIHQVA